MMQYSLLDRRPEESILDLLESHKISVIARGPVADGLLSSKAAKAYLDYSAAEVAELQQQLETLVKPGRSKAQTALRYALAQPTVATLIPGASRLAQLAENAAAAQSTLNTDELATLQALTRANRYEQHR
jgi:aryl-alcohol dehydrogenase-like predicted oxidoreductase